MPILFTLPFSLSLSLKYSYKNLCVEEACLCTGCASLLTNEKREYESNNSYKILKRTVESHDSF